MFTLLALKFNLIAFWTLGRIFWTPWEYTAPSLMSLLTGHSAVILSLAALACAALGLAIYLRVPRNHPRNSEILVLDLMIASLAIYFGLLAAADALPSLGSVVHRADYVLRTVAQMCRVAFFMFGGHFLALTHRRTVLAGTRGERDFGRIVLWISYLGGGAALAALQVILWQTLATYRNWAIAAPALPDSFAWGFFGGFTAAFWIAIQVQILANLYTRVPDEKRQQSWISRFHFTSEVGTTWNRPSLLVGVKSRPRDVEMQGPWNGVNEWKAFLTLMIGTLAGMLLFLLERRFRMMGADPFALWTLAMELLPLAVLFPLVYYKTRFLFFDVLIKRGLLALILVAGALCVALIPAPPTVVWIKFAIFAAAWSSAFQYLDRVLDRYLFHRPDYDALLRDLSSEVRQFSDAPALIAHLTSRLQRALDLPYVRFEPEPDLTVAAAIEVKGVYDRRGYLLLGPRPRQQPWQSADLRFFGYIGRLLSVTLDYLEQVNRERELRELAMQSELKVLRAQINPHFFFNALNTVAELTQSNPAAAERTILNLARIFQFALDATRHDTISLGREVAFIESYLEIERARFEEKLNYRLDVPEELLGLPVPPMLIQPLVENAVRHGISAKAGPGLVTVTARVENDRLKISVADDGVGFDPTRDYAGLGLANVAQRVERLSGAGHWQVQSAPGEGALIRFDLEAVAACAS